MERSVVVGFTPAVNGGILALRKDRVTEAGRKIVVEIEFERSDLDYLRTSIAYAADVDIAVTEFRLANIYWSRLRFV